MDNQQACQAASQIKKQQAASKQQVQDSEQILGTDTPSHKDKAQSSSDKNTQSTEDVPSPSSTAGQP